MHQLLLLLLLLSSSLRRRRRRWRWQWLKGSVANRALRIRYLRWGWVDEWSEWLSAHPLLLLLLLLLSRLIPLVRLCRTSHPRERTLLKVKLNVMPSRQTEGFRDWAY